MRYAIKKPRPDLRRNTCGFKIPDGSIRVVDLSLENVDAVKNVVMYGYQVRQTDAPEGIYTEDEFNLLGYNGKQVTALSLGLVAPARPELDYLNEIEGL